MVLPVLVLALGVGGFVWLRATRPAVAPLPVVEATWAVTVEPARPEQRRPLLELFGTIVPAREVVLRSPQPGRIQTVDPRIRNDELVTAGTVVAELDPYRFELAIRDLEAQLRGAQARLEELRVMRGGEVDLLGVARQRAELAQREVERRTRLRGSQFASEAALDEARMALMTEDLTIRQREREIAALDAKIEQQIAGIAQLEVALDRARRDRDETVIAAPFTGFASDVELGVGREVRTGDALLKLTEAASLEVRFVLNDGDFGRLWADGLLERPLTIRWRVGGDTAFALTGRVDRVAGRIEAATGGIAVIGRLDPLPADLPLRPGAFVTVEILDRAFEDVVDVAESALFRGDTVFVVEDGRLVPRSVEVIGRRSGRLLLQGSFAAGEPVVTSRLAEMAPGLKVEIVQR
jgi:RND family efflux transporter MFP subunit